MKYRIGFDIGVASVGYAVLENDPVTEEATRILDLGVRTFASNEVPKTGESTAKNRREQRGVRRRNRRKHFRFERTIKEINNTFDIDYYEDVINNNDISKLDVYKLRADAINVRIDNLCLAKVILHILKYRGFKSNRKSQEAKENGKLLSGIKSNEEYMQANNYRTIGEAIYKGDRYHTTINGQRIYTIRNHDGNYEFCFLRDDLLKELKLILQTQQKLGNDKITDSFIDRITDIFYRQRNFDEGPGENSPYKAKFEVGKCTFIPQELRAPKASLTFEYFTTLQKVNSLRIDGTDLTIEQKNKIIEKLKETKDLSFKQVRNILDVDKDKLFNLCRYNYGKPKHNKGNDNKGDDNNLNENDVIDPQEVIEKSENTNFVSFSKTKAIMTALGINNAFEHWQLIDEIGLMLSLCKSDSTINQYIEKSPILSALSKDQIEEISKLNFDKFGSLSIKAMQMIIPYMENGFGYDKACEMAGFKHTGRDHNKRMFINVKEDEIAERLNDITSPVVKRAVNQTIRILNEIIKKYGSPQFVTVELARELSKTPNERKKIDDANIKRYQRNQDVVDTIINKYTIKPSGVDIVKYNLYLEQNGKCMYSGQPFELERLFEPNYAQIDHILPISRSFDDSYNNKILVFAKENQLKGNRTPYEYFGADEKRWNEYVARVNSLTNFKKKKNLLMQNFDEEKSKDFIQRNLNDTQYMGKFLFNLLQDYLLMSESKSKVQIRCVSGSITSYLRKCWGINKLREDGDIHHCIDAAVIAMATESQKQKIINFNKFKEVCKVNKYNEIINLTTGEKLTPEQLDQFEKENIAYLNKLLPQPYTGFVKELKVRATTNYYGRYFTPQQIQDLLSVGYTDEEIENIKPVFVSRMKTVKPTGAIHKDTMYSTRIYDKTGCLVKRVKLEDLTLQQKPEPVAIKGDIHPECSIKDYCKPLDDRKLYLSIKNHLFDDPKYFKHNPTLYKHIHGTEEGIKVEKVKVYNKVSNPVFVRGGAYENDSMYRIDIFKKDGKYYICPVYMSDVYAHKLPNRVIAQGKPWINIDKDSSFEFQFSLYQNDLIKLTSNKEIKLTKVNKNEKSEKPDEIKSNEFMLYYNTTCVSTASIEAFTYDRCYSRASIGLATMKSIKKYYVDIMGNIFEAPKEERKEI